MSVSYADFQQRRGRLPDLIEEALSIYDEFMKDDAYDAQRPLDKIADKLRSARDFYDAKHRSTSTEEVERLREHLSEQITHAQTRILDGEDLGASVWRIALEDIIRENKAALTGASNHVG